MKILVTGAAGYIGSVVTEHLVAEGHQVIALDNLQHGQASAVHPDAHFIQLDLLNRDGVAELFRSEQLHAVMHLAAEALIDESVRDPGRSFRANVTGGLNLVDAMVANRARRHGATGGKILGAGGGGFLLLYAPPKRHREIALALPELRRIPFQPTSRQ
jgi:UDP-glucose 4-epimerase